MPSKSDNFASSCPRKKNEFGPLEHPAQRQFRPTGSNLKPSFGRKVQSRHLAELSRVPKECAGSLSVGRAMSGGRAWTHGLL